MSCLHLVGSFHYDLSGSDKLESLLSKINPDVIAIELPEELNTRTLNMETFEKLLYLELNGGQIIFASRLINIINNLVGYEFKTITNYTNKNNIPVVYVDKDTAQFPEFTTNTDMIATFFSSMIKLFINDKLDYSNDNLFHQKCDEIFGMMGKCANNPYAKISERDQFMAKNIIKLLSKYNKIAFIGGILHINNIQRIITNEEPTINSICYDMSISYNTA